MKTFEKTRPTIRHRKAEAYFNENVVSRLLALEQKGQTRALAVHVLEDQRLSVI